MKWFSFACLIEYTNSHNEVNFESLGTWLAPLFDKVLISHWVFNSDKHWHTVLEHCSYPMSHALLSMLSQAAVMSFHCPRSLSSTALWTVTAVKDFYAMPKILELCSNTACKSLFLLSPSAVLWLQWEGGGLMHTVLKQCSARGIKFTNARTFVPL